MSTSISAFLSPGHMNYLVVGLLVYLFVDFIFHPMKMNSSDAWLFILLIMMFLTSYRHINTFKLSSILYTTLYFVGFIRFGQFLSLSTLTIEKVSKFLVFILYLYFYVLVIQQFCLLTGLPVINYTFGYAAEQQLRTNSLATEPSMAGIIVFMLMYFYIRCIEIGAGVKCTVKMLYRTNKSLLFMFLYAMITMGSTTALFMLILLFIKLVSFRSGLKMIPLAILVVLTIRFVSPISFERFEKNIVAISTLDPVIINETDHSGAFRIIPPLVYCKEIDFFSVDNFFGFCRDYDKILFRKYLWDGSDVDINYGGIFPSFILYYGLVSFIVLLFIYKKKCIDKIFSIDTLIFIQMAVLGGLNTQSWAMAVLFFMLMKYLNRHKNRVPCCQGRKLITI